MFWILLIAAGNFVLGYAVAVHLGWASWPSISQPGKARASESGPGE
jgi:hypothetical protein